MTRRLRCSLLLGYSFATTVHHHRAHRHWVTDPRGMVQRSRLGVKSAHAQTEFSLFLPISQHWKNRANYSKIYSWIIDAGLFGNYSHMTDCIQAAIASLLGPFENQTWEGGCYQLLSYTIKWRGRGVMRYWKSNGRVGDGGEREEWGGEVRRGSEKEGEK